MSATRVLVHKRGDIVDKPGDEYKIPLFGMCLNYWDYPLVREIQL
jgi:hypothetical protein